MAQENEWEREYRQSKFLTKENKPQTHVVRFVKWLKKNGFIEPFADGALLQERHLQLQVLDLGCGVGRNSFYFAELGEKVIGFEISETALNIAKRNAKEVGLDIEYKKQSIGEVFPLQDNSVDIVLDVTSSNSLTEAERQIYLIETHRVLKEGGYFLVKTLCKDGDQNAKNLLKESPGKEKDTYILPKVGITERVWTKEDFVNTYEKYFTILHLEKKTSYSIFNNQPYKRNFWIAYMKK
jgi:SAM-dependent methyltransferase